MVARDWAHLDELLHTELNPATAGRFHSHLAYRGVACASWLTQTSLQRLGGPFDRLERRLLRDFRKYAYPTIKHDTSDWEVLVVGQHFGLPTRLLDWTFSPLVALHFATWDASVASEDAVIWMVDYRALHARLPRQLREVMAEFGGDSFTIEGLSRLAPTVDEFDRLAGLDSLVLLEPPSLDARVSRQYAALSVAAGAAVDPSDILVRAGVDVARRIIIPAYLKAQARDRLDQDNITERMLLPGLDGLAQWLRRYYSPTAGLSRRTP